MRCIFNFVFLFVIHCTKGQHYDAEYDGLSESRQEDRFNSTGKQVDPSDEHKVNYTTDGAEAPVANKSNKTYTYEGGYEDIGIYNFDYQDSAWVVVHDPSDVESEQYPEVDGKADRTAVKEVAMDPDMYHPSVETKDMGQHLIKEDVNVSCGIHRHDPMHIIYHGFTYGVYTVNNGDLGCIAVNISPNEQSIDDAKKDGCGAEKEANEDKNEDIWTVELRIQKGPTKNPKEDYVYQVQCAYKTEIDQSKRITTVTVNDSDRKTKRITINVTDATASNLTLEVTDNNGDRISEVSLGTVIRLKAVYATEGIEKGIKVWNCHAMNGFLNSSKSYTFLAEGCGLGKVIPKNRGFYTFKRNTTNNNKQITAISAPFRAFEIPPNDLVYFQCTVIICYESSTCEGSSCEYINSKRKRRNSGRSEDTLFHGRKVTMKKITTTRLKVLISNDTTSSQGERVTLKDMKGEDLSRSKGSSKKVSALVLGGCVLLVTMFTMMTVCCTLVNKNTTNLSSSEQVDKTYETKVTLNPSVPIQPIKDVSPSTSRELEIEYQWSDSCGLIEDVAECVEGIRPFVPERILSNVASKNCVVRYTDGVKSTICVRPD